MRPNPPRLAVVVILSGLTSCTASIDTTTTTSQPLVSASTTTIGFQPSHLLARDLVGDLPIEILGPEGIGDYPVVVLFHGGGWFAGSPVSTEPLADRLAELGTVVFNATYRTSNGGYPESFDDVACAIHYARANAGQYSSRTEMINVVAHSAGAHLAATVALAGDLFGLDCPVGGSARVEKFVGLAGPYDPTIYPLMLPSFFGTRFEDDPAPWQAGNPYTYTDQNPDLRVLLAHGDADQLVPISSSELFAAALEEAGHQVTFEVLDGSTHQDARAPNIVGQLIFDFISG